MMNRLMHGAWSIAGAGVLLVGIASAASAVSLEYNRTIGQFGTGPEDLNRPQGLAVQPATNLLWVGDGGNDRLQVYDQQGNFVKTVGRSGDGLGEFDGLADLKFDPDTGNLYAGDVFNSRINVFDGSGNPIKSFGQFGPQIEGRAFYGPGGMTFDRQGHLYVTDFTADNIQVFNKNGDLLRTIGSSGTGPGQFIGPSGISISKTTGRLYVGDQLNNRIQVLEADGTPLFSFGAAGTGAGQLDWPIGVEVDEFDNVYVADARNSRVQVFDKNGFFTTSYGGPLPGAIPFSPPAPGQELPPGQFNWTGGAHYYNGELFVGDFFNSRIEVLDVNNQPVNEIPEPSTILASLLFGSGIAFRRLKKAQQKLVTSEVEG